MLIRVILPVLFIVSTITSSFAQDKVKADSLEGWKTKGNFNMNFSLVQLDNWAGGGENSTSLGSKLSFFADYKKGKSIWNNYIDLAYGQAKIGDQNFRKTDDQLIITSKYGYKLSKNWYASAAIDYRTQMTNGFKYVTVDDTTRAFLVSKFMAPGFLLATLGFEYKPNEHFYASISPVSSKSTFVLADDINETQYGLDEGKTSRTEFGYTIKAGYDKKDIVKNVDFTTMLSLFGNYSRLEHIDVSWETVLNFKINKYLTANYAIQVLYDDDIDVLRDDETVGPAVQIKQVLNLGFSYKF